MWVACPESVQEVERIPFAHEVAVITSCINSAVLRGICARYPLEQSGDLLVLLTLRMWGGSIGVRSYVNLKDSRVC